MDGANDENDEKLLEQNVKFGDDDDERNMILLEQNAHDPEYSNDFLMVATENYLANEDGEMARHHAAHDSSGHDEVGYIDPNRPEADHPLINI